MLGNNSSACQSNLNSSISNTGCVNIGESNIINNNNNNTSDKTDNNNVEDMVNTIDITSDFLMDLSDLDEMHTLTDSDLALLADPNKVRMLSEALQLPTQADLGMCCASSSRTKNVDSSQPLLSELSQTGPYVGNHFIEEITEYSPKAETTSSITSYASSEMYSASKSSDIQVNSINANDNNNSKHCRNNNLINSLSENNSGDFQQNSSDLYDQQQMPPPPLLPPIIISPAEVDNITVQLEKNQQCACKDCGKLFNSVWYLKQHAVKHSNDRPFKCKFCLKTYKFRSNLYQHKCPERNRHFGGIGQSFRKRLYTRGIAYTELYNKAMANHKANGGNMPENFETLGKTQKNRDSLSSASSSTSSALMSPSSAGFKGNFNFEALSANSQVSEPQISETNNSMHARVYHSAENNNASDLFPQYSNEYQQNYQDLHQQIYGETKLCETGGNSAYSENIMTGCSGPQQNSSTLQNDSYFRMNTAAYPPQYMQDLTCSSMFHLNCTECCVGCEQSSATDSGCIRDTPLEQEYIDSYIQKNRNRVYPCRKCKLSFPSREYLDRHIAYHNTIECEPYVCDQCPQRFPNEKLLQSHFLQHSDNSPHKCLQCFGVFRSALALRRHKDQCRQCYCPPFGIYSKLIVSPSAPLDPYGFVESEDEIEKRAKSAEHYNKKILLSTAQNDSIENNNNNKNKPEEYARSAQDQSNNCDSIFDSEVMRNIEQKHTNDSGVVSDCSTYSFTTRAKMGEAISEDTFYHQSNVYAFNEQNSKVKMEIMEEDKNESSTPAKGIEEEDEEEEDSNINKGNSKLAKNSHNINENNQQHQGRKYPYGQNFFNRAFHHDSSDGSGAAKFTADDEADLGFRSRLDSVVSAQSFSPPASSSSSTNSTTSSASSTCAVSPNMQNSVHFGYGSLQTDVEYNNGENNSILSKKNNAISMSVYDGKESAFNNKAFILRDFSIQNTDLSFDIGEDDVDQFDNQGVLIRRTGLVGRVRKEKLLPVTQEPFWLLPVSDSTYACEDSYLICFNSSFTNLFASFRGIRIVMLGILMCEIRRVLCHHKDTNASPAARYASAPSVFLHGYPTSNSHRQLYCNHLILVLLLQEYIRRTVFFLNTIQMLKTLKIPTLAKELFTILYQE